jgi:CBS domain-containing protein
MRRVEAMKVGEIMTQDVITVAPQTPIREAASLMVDHGISGLPVVDERGTLVGVLSEGDLILRQRARQRVPWWRAFFQDGERLARDYQKAAGTTVVEVMTKAVISVSPDLPIEAAALILDQRRIRRVPVVAGGRVVGIVSRGDLVKVLARAPSPVGGPPSDSQLVSEMRERLAKEPWVSHQGIVVDAENGEIVIWGLVASEAEKSAVETMARALPGVKGVRSRLLVESEIPYSYGM